MRSSQCCNRPGSRNADAPDGVSWTIREIEIRCVAEMLNEKSFVIALHVERPLVRISYSNINTNFFFSSHLSEIISIDVIITLFLSRFLWLLENLNLHLAYVICFISYIGESNT